MQQDSLGTTNLISVADNTLLLIFCFACGGSFSPSCAIIKLAKVFAEKNALNQVLSKWLRLTLLYHFYLPMM